jgi:HD-like signal output (HDOD) protein
VAQDPALTCKILRVVNSSLYGLHRPVADLNQAIGLLGIKPLKLLVLGFNLPDALFAEVAARELRWYWTNTLTRAVAARLLAEQLWSRAPHEAGSGDEAFTSGLLQDIGILVLLRELGEPYARFLTGVIEEKCHLASLEHDTIGFDHVQLSAALFERWQMPQRIVDAIAIPKRMAKLARLESPAADLPQILHLAELLMQLVGQGRLHVLAELLEAGRVYRGMTKSKLAALVEGLQPQVDQLGQALSLELSVERDYKQTLLDAHRHMAALSEQIAGGATPGSRDELVEGRLLSSASELTGAMRDLLERTDATASHERHAERHASPDSVVNGQASKRTVASVASASTLVNKLVAAANRCRERREELSLLIMEPNLSGTAGATTRLASEQARRALEDACSALDRDSVSLVWLSEARTAAIMANCERRAAIDVAQTAIFEVARSCTGLPDAGNGRMGSVGIGVATASVVPKNFDPGRMTECAARCLSAALMGGTSAVKSIEV